MPTRNTNRSALAAALVLLFSGSVRAEGGDATLGQRLAQEWCAKCHAIGRVGASPEIYDGASRSDTTRIADVSLQIVRD
jgi:mono/diheme cytochrome c family protein